MKPSDGSPKLVFARLQFEPRSVSISSFSVILTHGLVCVAGQWRQCGEPPALRIFRLHSELSFCVRQAPPAQTGVRGQGCP